MRRSDRPPPHELTEEVEMVLRAVLQVGEIGLGVLLAMGSTARTRARIVKTRIERG
jgi:hypothetical protein